LGLLLWGCSDSTGPDRLTGDRAGAYLEGVYNPESGSVLLELQTDPIPGGPPPVPVELIGDNLVADPQEQRLRLDVAIRNIGGVPLHAPARVILADFRPPGVTVVNADFLVDFIGPGPLQGGYGFIYDDLLGEDRVLEPGESSGTKTWEFAVPGLVGFSFDARVTFGLTPDLPRIAGTVFEDRNRSGWWEPGEPPYHFGGHVEMHSPSGVVMHVPIDPEGRYGLPVEEPGLYTLQVFPFAPDFLLPVVTTPNPLRIVLPPGPDGRPENFLGADFGIFLHNPEDSIPPVVPAERPLAELHEDLYRIIGAEMRGRILWIRVGFSGCQPEHPFTLFWSGDFMESIPAQTNVLLVHHHTGEMCDAYFERELQVDLGPIQRAYAEGYGRLDPIIVHLGSISQEPITLRLMP
jgi:hypothetical protein